MDTVNKPLLSLLLYGNCFLSLRTLNKLANGLLFIAFTLRFGHLEKLCLNLLTSIIFNPCQFVPP